MGSSGPTLGRSMAMAEPRVIGQPIRLSVASAAMALVLFCYSAMARAADPYDAARRDYPDLYQAYYDEGLLEYCGLQTKESMGGFALRRDELLAATPLSE